MPSPTSPAGQPLAWTGPARALLLVLAVVALLLGSVLDSAAVVVVAPLGLVAAAGLDLARSVRGETVPSPAPVIVLAIGMGVSALAGWPLDAAGWIFVGLCALASALTLAAARRAPRPR